MSVKRRTRNKEKKIAQIKEAFMSLVETDGYLKTTNKRIAQRARVSVGLVYKYFPRGKIDILRQLVLDSQAALLATEEQQIPTASFSLTDESLSSQPLLEFIRQMLEFIVASHAKNARFIRALEIAILADSSVFEDIVSWSQQLLNLKPIIDVLEKYGIMREPLMEKEMIINTNIIDLVIHRYIFYAGNPFSSYNDFLNYLVELFIRLFKIDLPV